MISVGYKKRYIIDEFFIYLILLIFLFADSSNKYLQYSNLLVIFFYWIFNVIINKNKFKYSSKTFLIFPLLLLMVWVYGVFIGLLNQNDYVFINNVGIIFFISFYLLNATPLIFKDFYKILLNVSFLSVVIYFYNIPNLYISINAMIINYVLGNRFAYNILGIFPFLIFPILAYNIFFNQSMNLLIKSTISNIFFFVFLLIFAIFFVSSKGIYLFILFTFFLLYIANRKKVNFIFYLIAIIFIFFSYNVTGGITIFGNQDPSNENRYNQFYAVIDELSIFGKGWGATYISDYLDRDDMGYSIELSYFNLIHKVGIFSIIFFIFYFFIFFKVFKLLKSNLVQHREVGLLCLGLTCYLFISIGNPSLFAPIFVFLNCILLILLNKASLYDKQ